MAMHGTRSTVWRSAHLRQRPHFIREGACGIDNGARVHCVLLAAECIAHGDAHHLPLRVLPRDRVVGRMDEASQGGKAAGTSDEAWSPHALSMRSSSVCALVAKKNSSAQHRPASAHSAKRRERERKRQPTLALISLTASAWLSTVAPAAAAVHASMIARRLSLNCPSWYTMAPCRKGTQSSKSCQVHVQAAGTRL